MTKESVVRGSVLGMSFTTLGRVARPGAVL
jgi:hypothetical protein